MVKSRRQTAADRSPTVTATEAAKNFGDLVNRVREAGVAFVVERQGRPIAEIAPIARRRCTLAELARWFEGRAPLTDAYASAVEEHVKRANRRRVPVSRWGR
jgi:antitoxin (DNA-binding transcriptional repressor) of toxin-antitoxin stability system